VDGYITLTEKIYRALRFVEHRLAPRAAGVITVSEPLADYIAAHLHIPRPLVLMNGVDLRALQAPVPFERGGRRIIAHSGYLSPGRHLPELVAALTHLPDDVALALVGDGALREKLIAQAQELGVAERLLIVAPVNPHNLPTTLAQADAAVILITADTLNYQFSLPNKFFEAVAAGLPLVYSPIQEIDRLVREYDLGVSCDPTDPRRIAEAIQTILQPENLTRYRENALKAQEVLNWETEEQKLIALYRRLLTG
jgi:glycosyltransferase involved in cell wall biosynthesis